MKNANKATLPAVLDQAVVIRHGRKDATLISFDAYQKLGRMPSTQAYALSI
ncbi:hypothetical protein QEZ48_02740 [Aquamicrobium lusatiense]|uniref:hypothetical protein n=1 Tax=Aquamicrobium lusatiense TaxID=89772 RepID=UPI0024581AFB|nr:hypothetical protein [Aquamicrobium lusatiense]MDH4989744.1 hypothetical protein [Aquamicrobium lusatiense]